MARTKHRRPPARRNPRRLDQTGRQERGDEDVWGYWIDETIDRISDAIIDEITRDTRIALRRKLNNDSR